MTKDESKIFLSGHVVRRELGKFYADLFSEFIYDNGYEIVKTEVRDDER